MCEHINAKTLKFLSLEGLYKALINEKRNHKYLNLAIIISPESIQSSLTIELMV